MSPEQLAPVVAVPLALLLFAGFWVAVTSLLAHLTGWPALAAEYPGGEEPQGERLRVEQRRLRFGSVLRRHGVSIPGTALA